MRYQIIENLPIEAYHHEKPHKNFLGSTAIKKASKSLLNYKYYMTSEQDQERKLHFDFGNAFELALLDTNEFAQKVAIFNADERPEPGKTFASKANKEWKMNFEAIADELNNYVIPKSGEMSSETIIEMVKACKLDPTISKLISVIDYQKSFFWQCPESGLSLKCRPDIAIHNKQSIIDVKTIDDASPLSVSRAISKFQYDLQAIQQIDGVQRCGYINKVDNYFWLFVEKKAPYHAQLYEFSLEDREKKMIEYSLIKKRIASAQASNDFPGYGEFANNNFGILTAKIY